MSKYSIRELWTERYGNAERVVDYAGRLMYKSACSDPNSAYHPTLDHVRPLSAGGQDVKGNIEICHRDTNAEKGDTFPIWKTNGRYFCAKRVRGSRTDYKIHELK